MFNYKYIICSGVPGSNVSGGGVFHGFSFFIKILKISFEMIAVFIIFIYF
jgi:hypothetical protein